MPPAVQQGIFSLSKKIHLAGLLLAVAPMQVLACSCMRSIELSRFDEVARAYEDADAVFSALVEAADPAAKTGTGMARLRVLQTWKGPRRPGDAWAIYTYNHPEMSNCAMEPASGEALMIYEHDTGLSGGISICTRSGPLFRAFFDLPVLDQLARRNPSEPLFLSSEFPPPRPDWLPELLMEIYSGQEYARWRAQH